MIRCFKYHKVVWSDFWHTVQITCIGRWEVMLSTFQGLPVELHCIYKLPARTYKMNDKQTRKSWKVWLRLLFCSKLHVTCHHIELTRLVATVLRNFTWNQLGGNHIFRFFYIWCKKGSLKLCSSLAQTWLTVFTETILCKCGLNEVGGLRSSFGLEICNKRP